MGNGAFSAMGRDGFGVAAVRARTGIPHNVGRDTADRPLRDGLTMPRGPEFCLAESVGSGRAPEGDVAALQPHARSPYSCGRCATRIQW